MPVVLMSESNSDTMDEERACSQNSQAQDTATVAADTAAVVAAFLRLFFVAVLIINTNERAGEGEHFAEGG